MSKYPQYRELRRSFGLNVLGTVVIEVEADDGTIGFAPTTGGEIAAWIVGKHLARFVEGAAITDIERIWDQMYLATASTAVAASSSTPSALSIWRCGICWRSGARNRCTNSWAALFVTS